MERPNTVNLTDLVLIALLETGNARIVEVTASPHRRAPCDFAVDLSRFDAEVVAAGLESLAARMRALPSAPTAEDLRDVFGTTMLRTIDDRLRGQKAQIAAARRA